MGNNQTLIKCYLDTKIFIEKYCKPRLYDAKFSGLNVYIPMCLILEDMAIFYTGGNLYSEKIEKIRSQIKNGKYIESKYADIDRNKITKN